MTLAGAHPAQTSISREVSCQILADLPGKTQFFNSLSPCCAGAALGRDRKRANSLWKASASQIPDHFHSAAVPGFHAGKPATVFGREFEDPFPELLGLKFLKE